MAIDYAGALLKAEVYYDATRQEVKFKKSEAVRELTAFGLFDSYEIGKFLGATAWWVNTVLGKQSDNSYPKREWNVKAVSSLRIIAETWRDGGDPDRLIAAVAMHKGASVRAIHELTGVPLDRIRSVVW